MWCKVDRTFDSFAELTAYRDGVLAVAGDEGLARFDRLYVIRGGKIEVLSHAAEKPDPADGHFEVPDHFLIDDASDRWDAKGGEDGPPTEADRWGILRLPARNEVPRPRPGGPFDCPGCDGLGAYRTERTLTDGTRADTLMVCEQCGGLGRRKTFSDSFLEELSRLIAGDAYIEPMTSKAAVDRIDTIPPSAGTIIDCPTCDGSGTIVAPIQYKSAPGLRWTCPLCGGMQRMIFVGENWLPIGRDNPDDEKTLYGTGKNPPRGMIDA